jgi:hypothetical protein
MSSGNRAPAPPAAPGSGCDRTPYLASRALCWDPNSGQTGSSSVDLLHMSTQNAFGTFLETRELLRKGESEEDLVKQEVSPSEVHALRVLTQSTFPAPLPRLLEQSGLPLDEFARALERLKEAQLIRIAESDGQEVAELTRQGEALKAT